MTKMIFRQIVGVVLPGNHGDAVAHSDRCRQGSPALSPISTEVAENPTYGQVTKPADTNRPHTSRIGDLVSNREVIEGTILRVCV
jgi:hypothetical protein